MTSAGSLRLGGGDQASRDSPLPSIVWNSQHKHQTGIRIDLFAGSPGIGASSALREGCPARPVPCPAGAARPEERHTTSASRSSRAGAGRGGRMTSGRGARSVRGAPRAPSGLPGLLPWGRGGPFGACDDRPPARQKRPRRITIGSGSDIQRHHERRRAAEACKSLARSPGAPTRTLLPGPFAPRPSESSSRTPPHHHLLLQCPPHPPPVPHLAPLRLHRLHALPLLRRPHPHLPVFSTADDHDPPP